MAYKRSRQAYEADLQKQANPFVLYGTPLPPLDDQSRDDGSYVPVWKQEVTDERGRKRLHGAFTGGFSAGYFNTVGSKEGWTPSTFVSSRQNRMRDNQKLAQQRPEDFMDEEDKREAEDARTLHTSDEFAGFGTEHDAMRKSATIDIFRPSGETIGSKLLKRMGWREGQGIGPRVKRAANLGDNQDEPGEMHFFAPDDVPTVSLTRKRDYKGLGYRGELQGTIETKETPSGNSQTILSRNESSDEEQIGPRLASSKKLSKRKPKSGFGVGVLNDDGSDDEDPYSMGPSISYARVIGGDKRHKNKPKTKGTLGSVNPSLKSKHTFISKKLVGLKGALRKCHDGRLPLDGFVLADELDAFGTMTLQDDKYKPPEVPPDWKSSVSKEKEAERESGFVSTADAARLSNMTAKSRALLLGELQLPGKSVFDFLTPAARERLAAASGRDNLPPAGNEAPPPGYENSVPTIDSPQHLVPRLDRDIALQALSRGASGWMPYAEDEQKRARYRRYLEIQVGLRQTEGGEELPPRAEGMKEEDWILEMEEFARAAEVFKPISGLMASRFTSSSSLPHGRDGDSSSAPLDSLLTRPNAKPEDPAESAAKLGMFGPMTRSFLNFYPTRLLCKRFNLPLPDHSNSTSSGVGGDTPLSGADGSVASQFRAFTSAGLQQDTAEADKADKGHGDDGGSNPEALGKSGNVFSAPTALDPERNEAIEQERPGLAVFRAIFGSVDEDD